MKNLFWITSIILLVSGCMKEDLDFSKFSKTMNIEREQALPLVKGDLSFKDIAGHSYDSIQINAVPGVDTIFLYLLNKIDFRDTIKLGNMNTSGININFIKLYHTFTNQFPIGLNIHLYLYDSTQKAIIDSIPLNQNPNTVFLQPAPLNSNGLVDTTAVQSQSDVLDLTATQSDELFHQATHIILNAKIPTSGDYIKTLKYYSLSFKLGIDAQGTYKGQF